MIRIPFIVVFYMILLISQNSVTVSAKSIQQVSLCNLVRYPERYENISIAVSATYREIDLVHSQIYCFNCADLGEIGVNLSLWQLFDDGFDLTHRIGCGF